jgi:hypothetical protein
VEKLRSSGVSLRKPGPNCKDLIRWKGLFMIFETTGVFLQDDREDLGLTGMLCLTGRLELI